MLIIDECQVRVRYAETDQMGVVYHGDYAQYFEIGRVELMRKLGSTYRKMEEDGVMLPVLKLELKYIRPAKYDDLLTIETVVKETPNTRLRFHHRIFNAEKTLLTTGLVELVFVNISTGRPIMAPVDFVERLSKFDLDLKKT
ncbi:MAG: acyl-CoA thioesterase [Schleiferiaceae bacterium]|nr:acyl-CoA thioesterase [Schleiferiaceae bacterium]